jgi:pantoate--beta-alanine ligase
VQTINQLDALRHHIAALRDAKRRVALVPTMGALHDGHMTLVEAARRHADAVVVSIFVNPTQFGPNEDLSKYPRTLESDIASLRLAECDFVFVPASDQIYRKEHSTYVDPPGVSTRWEGELRPGHFRGVTTIVLKLFQLIPAHVAYFGRKDYQQVAVIRSMVDDLNVPIRIETCPTVREADGLAMSSRNRYLSDRDRPRALGLWRALCKAQSSLNAGIQTVAELEAAMHSELLAAQVDFVDYATIVHPDTLEPMMQIGESAVALIAAKVGGTRLIDNMTLLPPIQRSDEGSK